MADVEEACFTGLSLGLGVDGYCLGNSTKRPKIERRDEPCALSLGPYFSAYPEEEEGRGAVDRPVDVAGTAIAPRPRASKNRDSNSVATGNIDSSNLDGCRRKLRLSKDQSALLEDSFKIHRTLTPVLTIILCTSHDFLVPFPDSISFSRSDWLVYILT